MFGRISQTITFYDSVTPVAIATSTDASPIVIATTGAHGFVTGQRVLIFGHSTNVAANGIYLATVVSSTAFSISDEFSHLPIAGSGAGAGSGGAACKAPEIASDIQDMQNIDFELDTSGSASMTLKTAISAGISPSSQNIYARTDLPNFGATVTAANPYSFAQVENLENYSAVNGNTGIVLTGTDVHASYEVNVNVARYCTVIPTAWTAGTITIRG